MRILGISGSPRKDDTSGVNTFVRTVLEATGCEYELVSLKAKKISGCIACLECVEDNICKVQDDLTPLRDKIVKGGLRHRRAQLLHQHQCHHPGPVGALVPVPAPGGDLLWGKLAVVIGVGGSSGQPPADTLERYMAYNFVDTIAKVTAQGAASCFSCGFGRPARWAFLGCCMVTR